MTVYLSRDYVQSATGIGVQQAGTPYFSMTFYQLAVFINRILGYSVVGANGINLDTTFRSLSISAITSGIPTAVTTGTPHGLPIGSTHCVQITGSTGVTGLNSAHNAIVTGTSTLSLRSFTSGTLGGAPVLTTGLVYASGLVADGYGAGINFGVGANFEVSIPSSVRTVVVGDVGKMLVLKSSKFPTKNAGLFKISGINAGTNRYIIDYRSTEAPPVEASNSIDWWLYEAENVVANQLYVDTFWWHAGSANVTAATNTSPIAITASNGNGSHNLFTGQRVLIEAGQGNTAMNGIWTVTVTSPTTFTLNGSAGNGTYVAGTARFHKTGYPGGGLSGNPRIIFQSPHSTGWQVRLCLEPRNANLPPISITTGFSGDSIGDFPVNDPQTHITEYIDINSIANTVYIGSVPGQGDNVIQQRVSFVGETNGQYLFMWTRPTSGVRLPGITMVGVPDNEPTPLPLNNERVFVYSPATGVAAGNQEPGGTTLRIGPNLGNVGATIKNGAPKFAALTGWANLDGSNLTTPLFNTNAGDTPFTGATEVLPIEIWAGTYADVTLGVGVVPPFSFDQSFMGTSPLLRIGRSNFSTSPTLTTEEITSRTITAATNATPIQITTSVANNLVTGQTVTISGVTGNTAANGTFVITRVDSTNFTLNGSVGNGAYISGGTVNGCASWIHLTNGMYMQWNGPSGITA
jgi:hypothetical protein